MFFKKGDMSHDYIISVYTKDSINVTAQMILQRRFVVKLLAILKDEGRSGGKNLIIRLGSIDRSGKMRDMGMKGLERKD